MMTSQRTVGFVFLVGTVAASALLGCSSNSTDLGHLPGSGGQQGGDANHAADVATPDTVVQGIDGALAAGGSLGTGGGIAGSVGAAGGAVGTGGTAGTTTTSCPTLPNCNWCGGQSLKDSRGCTTGWRCANNVDPCAVNPCSASSPCEAGKTCGSDHLCWPSGTGGAGGVVGLDGGATGGAGGSTGTPVRLCGSVAGIHCQSGEFCEYSAEACQIMDAFGVCSKLPASCPSYSEPTQPVCGCDGKTYASDCERQLAGMSKLLDSACGTLSDGGVTSSLSVNPSTASFSEGIGLTSEPVTFVIANQGTGASGGLDIRIIGPSTSAPLFMISNSSCIAFLPAGQTCQVLVAFKAPSTPGTYTAGLSIKESGGEVVTASLSGYAFPPPGGIDGGATDAATGTECPEIRPTSDSECSVEPTMWCSYIEAGPNQIVCNCSNSRWGCSIASP